MFGVNQKTHSVDNYVSGRGLALCTQSVCILRKLNQFEESIESIEESIRRIDNISSIMKSRTEIHSNSAIELQVYHLITCSHNFCIMSLLSRQQSFTLQVKRICRDSSFVTLRSFSAKLSLPARFFSHCFGSTAELQPFTYCEAIRHVISVESWQVESWPSNHVWKSGCIHNNEISCKSCRFFADFYRFAAIQPRLTNVCLCFCQSVPRFSLAIMLWSLSSQGRRGIRISSSLFKHFGITKNWNYWLVGQLVV